MILKWVKTDKDIKNERMGLIVYDQYIFLKKLRQLEPQRNENGIKRFQDCDLPAHFDKLLRFATSTTSNYKDLKKQ